MKNPNFYMVAYIDQDGTRIIEPDEMYTDRKHAEERVEEWGKNDPSYHVVLAHLQSDFSTLKKVDGVKEVLAELQKTATQANRTTDYFNALNDVRDFWENK